MAKQLRKAYARMIRTRGVGPFLRLPMRLFRWFAQAPDDDPSIRVVQLTSMIEAMREQIDKLSSADDVLRRRQAHLRLTTSMMAASLITPFDPTEHLPDPRRVDDEVSAKRV